MSIACPYCRAVLKIKEMKVGRHTPQCPRCANPFIVVVPADETGTIKVQPMKLKQPTPNLTDTVRVQTPGSRAAIETDKLPAASSRPAVKTAPPGAETDSIVKGRGSVKAHPPRANVAEPENIEDAAAALLESDDSGGVRPPAEPK